MNDCDIQIRLAQADDDAFILGLVGRFVDFELPPWRVRAECAAGIERDLALCLDAQPPGVFMYVAMDAAGQRLGFLHLQQTRDYFTQRWNCHISDIAVADGAEGRGVGRRLMAYADAWAIEHDCDLVTLSVFPGNTRAHAMYEKLGFATDLLRMAKRPKR